MSYGIQHDPCGKYCMMNYCRDQTLTKKKKKKKKIKIK